MRLIDADELWNDITKEIEDCEDILEIVEKQPIVVPGRKKGEWIDRSVDFDGKGVDAWQCAKCSVCGLYHSMPYSYYFNELRFCPNCGAEMKVTEMEGEEQ